MAHEELHREEHIEGSSDRSFGVVFAVVFALIAAWPLLGGGGLRGWAAGVSAAFLAVALARPSLLSGLNRQWLKLGLLLGKIVSPIALGVLFYLVFTPMGVLMRLAGKDPLRLKMDRAAGSYWMDRKPPGPPPGSMTNQF
ncbi:MAG TPA: SxtJ family membrane protein [Methylibium sp.]|nr:SxtJ family membrane protein [Methylibium sp.]